ncbi:MAG TPA: aminoglycoside adenylyltransferase domain-containing protein [Chloroflexota bacterium]
MDEACRSCHHARRRALRYPTCGWTAPKFHDERDILLERPGTRAFAILTACRMLHTFRTGAVVSKVEAAEATLQRVALGHANAINAAMRWRKHDPDQAASPEEAVRLLEFVQARVKTVR